MTDQSGMRRGLTLGLGAYLIWGFLPLYFKLLSSVDAFAIVAHRIVWSLLFLAVIIGVRGRWRALKKGLANPRALCIMVATAILIAINWLVYIWAVINGHVLEGSLGYYLNPLINVLLGVVLLKERLGRPQIAAVLIAAAGVSVLAVQAGAGLWISLTLAFSFGLYGFLRKIAPVDSLEGLSIETLLLAPFALLYLFAFGLTGNGSEASWDNLALLALGGVVTAVPLLLFASAARALPYSTLGFLQYIAPTIQFLLAIFMFGEHLTPAHMICFAAIWSALAIFAFDGVRRGRAATA